MTFTLRNPIWESPHLRDQAVVVSRHSSALSAYRALLRLRVGAQRQGYRCEAYIWDEEENCLVPDANIGHSRS